MSITIIINRATDALYLNASPTKVGECSWLVEVRDEYKSVVLMLVRNKRAEYV